MGPPAFSDCLFMDGGDRYSDGVVDCSGDAID